MSPMKGVDSESSSDSIEKKDNGRDTNRFVQDGPSGHGSKNSKFSFIKSSIPERPKGVGGDDVNPFAVGGEMRTSPRPIKGMYATPRDIYDIRRQRAKKSNENSSKSEDELPCADYDPINPFRRGNDPDPDHFQPPK